MAEFNCLIHRFSLDVNDTAAQVSLACKRGDTGIQLRIILTDNGIPYEITPGSAAVFTATKPDGTNLYNYCRIEGNTVVYDFTEQTVNVPGQVDVELRLTYGGMVLTSPSFLIIVDETIYDDLVPTSSNEATALTGLIGKSEAAVTACESATANATQSASAAAKAAHEADLAADNARGVAQTVQDMLDSGKFQGETTLPVARASSGDGIAYAATDAGSGCTLPTVSVADNMAQISAVGKGRQIVFVPEEKNLSTQPTLQINGGEIIPLRLRAPQNQGTSDYKPDATLPVPVGALMRGVPYTLTFCGKYWLVDSQICGINQIVEVNITKNADGTYTSDKTFEELKSAHDGGHILICSFDDLTMRYDCAYLLQLSWANGSSFGFSGVFEPEQDYKIMANVWMNSRNDIGFTATVINDFPRPTAADAGKVLTASAAGRAAWTSVTNAEEVAV